MADTTQNQIDISERLQLLLLQRWETLLTKGEMQPTDAATLARFLRENGWNVDPSKLPENLRNVLTERIDPKTLADDDHEYGGGAGGWQ